MTNSSLSLVAMFERAKDYDGHGLYTFSPAAIRAARDRYGETLVRERVRLSNEKGPDGEPSTLKFVAEAFSPESWLYRAEVYTMRSTVDGVTNSVDDFDTFLASLRKPTMTEYRYHLNCRDAQSSFFIMWQGGSTNVQVEAEQSGDLDRIFEPLDEEAATWESKFAEYQAKQAADREAELLANRGGALRRLRAVVAGGLQHPLFVGVMSGVIGAVVGSVTTFYLTRP